MTETELRGVSMGPLVAERTILFRFPDPDHELRFVNLFQDIRRPRNGPPFAYNEDSRAWELEFPRPPADRMEYQLELGYEHDCEVICDPGNELRVPGAFGDKSVLEFESYKPPRWLDIEPARLGQVRQLSVKSRTLRGKLPVELWSPDDAESDEPLPLLIAHDGPEYARYSSLTHMLDVLTEERSIPRLRAALVGPIDRDQTYSASAAYARSFAHELIPTVLANAPTPHGRSMRIGMGASLGALAMLHIHRRNPASFGALYLQSGSFFRQRYDKQESGFSRFRRISRFMGEVLTADDWAHPITVTLTCGTVEENVFNNRATSAALQRQGYEAKLIENRDAHNYVGWRDTFDPHLVDLINRMWA